MHAWAIRKSFVKIAARVELCYFVCLVIIVSGFVLHSPRVMKNDDKIALVLPGKIGIKHKHVVMHFSIVIILYLRHSNQNTYTIFVVVSFSF